MIRFSACLTFLSALVPAATVTALLAVPATAAFAQMSDASSQQQLAPMAGNGQSLVVLKGNTSGLAQPRYDQGAVAPDLATGKLQLLLRRPAAQQAALRQYLDSLQDPHSAGYHKWLTPQQYGTRFGLADQDLQTVETWLTSQGFKIESVPASRNFIQFSGTAGQVGQAFHTSIHTYAVAGAQHHSNSADPWIPAALSPLVAGISPLNDFRAHSQHVLTSRSQVQRTSGGGLQVLDRISRGVNPQYVDTSSNVLYVTPADAATIYNSPNTFNHGYTGNTPVTGTGVKIGIAGYSDLAVDDYKNYRKFFLNESAPVDPTLVVDGVDPGVLDQHDGQETLLDAEMTAGLAPGASIYVYSSQSDLVDDGLTNSIIRAIQDNQVDVLSVSYTRCETSLGPSGNQEFSELWQQAAAQGISVVVAAGDTGAAGCDDATASTATGGLTVSGFASTPYNVAVGGTDFDVLNSQFATYVNSASGSSTPAQASALGYIPESPWNDSITNNPPADAGTNTAATYDYGNGPASVVLAGGGGASSLAYCAAGVDPSTGNCTGTLSGYPTPPFQSGLNPVPGAPAGVRYLPDVSLFAGENHEHPATWAACSDNLVAQADYTFTDCTPDANGNISVEGAGGTAASTAAFTGILGLVLQSQNQALGHQNRLGVANNILYNLYATTPGAFHDVTAGNNSVPCTTGSPDCAANGFLSGYNAGTGFDLASGLGSVDVSALIAAWQTATFTPTTTTLLVNNSASAFTATHGTMVPLSATVVNAGSASGAIPTGSVSVIGLAGQGGLAVSDSILLAGGTGQISVTNLPGGTYSVTGYYPGDITHSPSQSPQPGIQLTINPENSVTVLSLQVTDVNTSQTYTNNTFPYGSYGFVYAQPEGSAGADGIATGMVTLLNNGANLGASQALNSQGRAAFPVDALTPNTYNFGARYSGDASYNASQTTNATTVTITKGQTQLAAVASSASIDVSASATITVTLSTDSTGAFPSGNITLSANGQTFSGTTQQGRTAINADQEVATFTVPGSALANGANTITANYPGDGNYLGSMNTTTITVTGGSTGTPGFTLAGPNGGVTVTQPGVPTTGTVTVTPTNGFTGTVSLTCTVASTTGAAAPSCTVSPSVTLSSSAVGTATLTINTTAPTTQVASLGKGARGSGDLNRVLSGAGSLALCSLFFFGMPARRRSWRAMLVVLFAVGTLGMMGCGFTPGPGTKTAGGTPAGNYTATVTGTSGSIVVKTTVAVVVK